MTTANLHLLEPQQEVAAELAAKEHEARLVVQIRNATIAECQRELRATADHFERLLPGASLPTMMAAAYRSGADHLEVLRS
jgi:hypothetical protein